MTYTHIVTKKYTSGLLKGQSVNVMTNKKFTVGKEYRGLNGEGNYTVTAYVTFNEFGV